MKRVLNKIFERAVSLLPPEKLGNLIYRVAVARSATLMPDGALRFLFRLDVLLYGLQGKEAIRYGGGIHTKHRHLKYHDFFVDRIDPDQSVLDVGCGIGALAADVAKKGSRVVGMDLNPDSVMEARDRYPFPNLEFRVGDILMQVPAEPFDVIILSNVLEHLPDRSSLIRNLASLTGASVLLIRVPLFERDWRVPLKKELGVEWRLDVTHHTEYTLKSFSDEIDAAGLKIRHLEIHWGEIWAEISAAV